MRWKRERDGGGGVLGVGVVERDDYKGGGGRGGCLECNSVCVREDERECE